MLRLTVVSPQGRKLGAASSHLFGEAGGTFGRSARCDWMLPDEKHHLSAQHARIVHDGRGYTIIDTSTNGVYLNGRDVPLGRNQSALLRDGDRLYLADYVIDVAVTDRRAAPKEVRTGAEHGKGWSPIPADLPLGAGSPPPGGDASAFWEALGLTPSSLSDDARERLMRGLGGALREAVAILAAAPRAAPPAAVDEAKPGDAALPELSLDVAGELDRTIRTLVEREHAQDHAPSPAEGRTP